MKQKRKKAQKIQIGIGAIVVLLCCIIGLFFPKNSEESEETRLPNDEKGEANLIVTYLDVGQGNAILVQSQDDYMLIDGGGKSASSYVVSYLQQQNITELDYVISSHYDADHVSGLIGVLYKFQVETVLDGDYIWDTKTYQSFQTALEKNGCNEIHPNVGDIYELGDATFEIVCPDRYGYSDGNENSIGIRLCYGDSSFLICGDAGEDMEKWMVENGNVSETDVLMASHHGSFYSTSEVFFEAVNPNYVVISAGRNNTYGHPSNRVMKLLGEKDVCLYRTDIQGTIIAYTDGKNIWWNVKPCTDYRDGTSMEE